MVWEYDPVNPPWYMKTGVEYFEEWMEQRKGRPTRKFFSERQRRWWFWYLQSSGHYLPFDILAKVEFMIYIGMQEILGTYGDLFLELEKINDAVTGIIGGVSPTTIVSIIGSAYRRLAKAVEIETMESWLHRNPVYYKDLTEEKEQEILDRLRELGYWKVDPKKVWYPGKGWGG